MLSRTPGKEIRQRCSTTCTLQHHHYPELTPARYVLPAQSLGSEHPQPLGPPVQQALGRGSALLMFIFSFV